MCIYMQIHLYMYIYVYICVYKDGYIYIYIYIYIYLFVYVYKCVYVGAYMSIYVCIYIHIHIYIYVFTYNVIVNDVQVWDWCLNTRCELNISKHTHSPFPRRFFVEETFGRLKNRFRFLLAATGLSHRSTTRLVYAALILHNLCTIHKDDHAASFGYT